MSWNVLISSIDAAGQTIYVTFNLSLVQAGGYTTNVGGDAINFATAGQDPSFIGMLAAVESSQLVNIDMWSMGGNVARSYFPNKVGVSPATGAKLKIGGAFGAELGTGAYPSDVIADTVTGMAVFTHML
jgi:hypothetical protein